MKENHTSYVASICTNILVLRNSTKILITLEIRPEKVCVPQWGWYQLYCILVTSKYLLKLLKYENTWMSSFQIEEKLPLNFPSISRFLHCQSCFVRHVFFYGLHPSENVFTKLKKLHSQKAERQQKLPSRLLMHVDVEQGHNQLVFSEEANWL